VLTAGVRRRACYRVLRFRRDGALVDVVAVDAVQMAVVKVVRVVTVPDVRMPAARTVRVTVSAMSSVLHALASLRFSLVMWAS
jgi:hypothetical protein